MKKLVAIIVMVGLFGVACSKQEAKKVATPLSETNRILDPVKMKSTSAAMSAHENYALTLKKDFLGELFLLRSALVQSIPNPTGHHMAAKVVYFKKNGNTVGLFELTDRHYETSAIPTEVLLTTFPTISEDAESLTIDFNKGMSKLFYSGSTFASDLDDENSLEEAITINDSFVDKAVIKGDVLYIDQFVRITEMAEGKQYNSAMRVKYNFQSYSYNAQFPSKLTTGQNKVGFFEVNPLIVPKSAERQVMIAKWNIEKPITFYISRNTPAEMVQPITDAVLYWNKAFKEAVGKEPLRVEMLPEGVDLYTPGYNIIQWMDNDVAGAAYADMEADPLTGEIIRSNIYMPSIFATSSESDAYDTLLELIANSKDEKTTEKRKSTFALKSFKTARMAECFDIHERAASMNVEVQAMIAESEKSGEKIDVEAIIKRFRDDSVRETVSHEVGHTLGLRHNFAGSTYTTVNKDNFAPLTKSYFLTGNIATNQKFGSSIMDYNVPMFAAMIGANIRLGLPALAYDAQAIKWGYTDLSAGSMSFGPFCTDGHLMTNIYSDCKQFDQFRNATEGTYFSYNQRIEKAAFIFANAFSDILGNDQIADKTPYLKRVSLNPLNITRYVMNGFASTVNTLSPVSQSINVLQKFGAVSYFNQKDYLETTNAFKRQSVASIGGLTKLALTDFTPAVKANAFTIPVVDKIRSKFEKNMNNLYEGLSDSEKLAIKEAADRFFNALATEMLTTHAALLNQATFFEIDESFPAALSAHLDAILFAKGTEELGRNQDGSMIIMKPAVDNIRGDLDLRALAVTAAVHNFFPSEASYDFDRAEIGNGLWNKYTAERKILTDNVQNVSRKALNWIRTEDKRFAPVNPN